ncbi:MAG: hypothetical protein E7052_01535 [Lentisphaerae bacterium]|nr:hypothetical protein [Lentisphaerota bacterium]
MKYYAVLMLLVSSVVWNVHGADERPYLYLTGQVLNSSPAVGDTIKVKISSKSRKPFFFHATRLFVYRKDSGKVFENARLKFTPHKSDSGYDAAELAPWAWFPRVEEHSVERQFSTVNWLPGTYTIVIHALYYPEQGNKNYKFSGSTFNLTLKQAAWDSSKK